MRIGVRPVCLPSSNWYGCIEFAGYADHAADVPPSSSLGESAIFPLSFVYVIQSQFGVIVSLRFVNGISARSTTKTKDVTFGKERWVTVDRRPASTGWFPWRSTILRTGRRQKTSGVCSSDAARSATFTSPGIASRARAVVSRSSGKSCWVRESPATSAIGSRRTARTCNWPVFYGRYLWMHRCQRSRWRHDASAPVRSIQYFRVYNATSISYDTVFCHDTFLAFVARNNGRSLVWRWRRQLFFFWSPHILCSARRGNDWIALKLFLYSPTWK